MKKRILVTGSKGFIGSHLIPELKKSYDVAEWDLVDKKDIFDADFPIMVKNCDVVIHLAAETSVNDSFNRERDFMELNVLGTARVAELCLKYGKKLIFPSTGAYYNRGLSPYAQSKSLADDICQALQKFHPVTILRFFNIYGTNMNERTGSILYNFAQAAVKKEKIVIFGSGDQTRDFISVKDVAKIVKAAIDPSWDGKIVDVGTGEEYTINYVAELFSHYTNGKLAYQDLPKREIKWSIANTGLLKTLYKKPLESNLKKDIKEIVDYYGKTN